MTPFWFVANAIAQATPYDFIPTFVPAPNDNANIVDYDYPTGTYTSSITSANQRYQHWASKDGIIMKSANPDSSSILEQIEGGSGDDVIWGGNGYDGIVGDGGNDLIMGGAGDSWLFGQDGNDVIVGGYDLVRNSGSNFLSTWKDLFQGSMTDAQIEAQFVARSGNNDIAGGDGADVLMSSYGNDSLSGGDGNDTMYAGDGNDTVYGETRKGDFGWYDGQTGNDYIDAQGGNDIIYGQLGNDTILGGSGDDSLYGEDGADYLAGGVGADILNGGDGNDYASYETATSGITLNLTNISLNTGDAAGDTFSGIEGYVGSQFNDTMKASANSAVIFNAGAGNDNVYGHIGNDYLIGGTGNDVLQGGPGDDSIFGGTGDDTYLFTSGEAIDRVIEYANEGTDMLYVGADIAQLSLGQAGNNLLFYANNGNDVLVVENWFVNQAVENIALLSTGYMYSIADLVASILPSSSEAQPASLMASNEFDFSQAAPIDLTGVPSVEFTGTVELNTLA